MPLSTTSSLSQAALSDPDNSVGKESACNAGDPGSIPGSGRSAAEGIGYPLQYSGLENSMDCIVHGVTKSQTQLSDFHCHQYSCLENPVNSMERQKDKALEDEPLRLEGV